MDLNIKMNNTGVYVTKRNWFISMTYDYSWVPKIQTFEVNWIRKKFASSQVKLCKTNVFVKVIAFGKA